MKDLTYTILGSNGSVGRAVLDTLQQKNLPVKTVNRQTNNQENYPQAAADLTNNAQTIEAIAGSKVVYLCIGLPYRTQVWQTQWEIVMSNVIEACQTHQAKLVYLDNMYMYQHPLPVPFDENTPQNPSSTKGKARKRTAQLLLDAISAGKVQGLIGRSADFYGPGATNSHFYIAFLERMLQGKSPQTLTKPKVKHTYAHVQDVGRALVELSLQEDCYGQVWHLPMGKPTTTQEMLDLFNQVLGTNYPLKTLPTLLRKLLTYFNRPLKEAEEMMYQFEQPYEMSFEKFSQRFPDFQVTPYEQGVAQMVTWFKERVDE